MVCYVLLLYVCGVNHFDSFLALAEPNIVILPKPSDGNEFVYEVEEGREFGLVCYSDISANLQVTRAENGNLTIPIPGKTNQPLFLISMVYNALCFATSMQIYLLH